ncbi:hypothetical protein Egran_05944 [Elaphomyces granulatus]|uniref:DUF676 domain-containing protein n=1 Tax=Elaphomyces granulatus TaxID=519963 RepID=A0A232LQL4_9EURO|nr:hypothetical protein Egran_05944 [Elaphomyces granulatus]
MPKTRRTIRREGFTCLNPEGEHEVDIVFVHGLNGHPNSTWRHSTTGFLWPRELVTQVPGARILLYGYVDAELRDSDHIRIRGLAERFLSDLVNERHEEDALVIASQNKYRGVEDRDSIYLSTVGCFFFGTPNSGTSLDASDLPGPPKIREALKYHSDEVFDLAEKFLDLDICVEGAITMYTYYETLDLPELGFLLVDETSARFKDRQDRNFIQVYKNVRHIVSKPKKPVTRGGTLWGI